MHSIHMKPKEDGGYRAYMLNNDDGNPTWTSNDARFDDDGGIAISMAKETFTFEVELSATHSFFIAVHGDGLPPPTAEDTAAHVSYSVVHFESGVTERAQLDLDKARYTSSITHMHTQRTPAPPAAKRACHSRMRSESIDFLFGFGILETSDGVHFQLDKPFPTPSDSEVQPATGH